MIPTKLSNLAEKLPRGPIVASRARSLVACLSELWLRYHTRFAHVSLQRNSQCSLSGRWLQGSLYSGRPLRLFPQAASALLFAVTLSVWQVPAFAADWDLRALMKELGASSSGTARFVEKKYLAVLDTPIVQSGTLAYSPGHLEKITLLPRRERMVISGDALTIETGSGKKARHLRLARYPVLWGFVEGMRATLTGDLSTLQRFYSTNLLGPASAWELVLIPRQQEMRTLLRLISIHGGGGRINTIELVETSGDRSVTLVTEDPS